MSLFLEILDGDLKGTRTPARAGLVIGRHADGLTIRDSKLSGKHAELVERPDGGLWVVDLDSANGIKTTVGKVRELKLEPGLTFTLGRTPFLVISVEESSFEETPTAVMAQTVTRTFWDTVRDLAKRAEKGDRSSPVPIAPFSRAVRLKFVRGIQMGTVWTVGYGPREIGTDSIDLQLEDANLPGICFRLEPHEGGVYFKNESANQVRLNGKSTQGALLKAGDVIDIMHTQIQVEFDEGN